MFLLGVVSILMFTGVSADYSYGNSNDYSLDDETGFTIPSYDSQEELITNLVAPFLLISLLLQIGFNRALRFAFVDEDKSRDLLGLIEENRPSMRRESTLMSITATAMLVPTPFFQQINELVAWVFGGSIYILAIVAGIYFIYKLITSLW